LGQQCPTLQFALLDDDRDAVEVNEARYKLITINNTTLCGEKKKNNILPFQSVRIY